MRRSGFVLTRLHVRYGKEMSEDLVFRTAPAVVGGREIRRDGKTLETGANPHSMNMFQARYAIRHEWTGPIECKDPVRGRWGGPPRGEPAKGTVAAKDLAFAPRGQVQLAQLVVDDVPELGVKAASAAGGATAATPKKPHDKTGARAEDERKKGCGCATTSSGDAAGLGALVIAVVGLLRRRRAS